MILSAHQPNYLPYTGFFDKAAGCDLFVIWDTVQFVKRGPFGWIHRNKIRSKDGWMWLSVPVLTKDKYRQLIIDTRIDNDLPWERKHWRSICLNYEKAPHFGKYSAFFEGLYKKKWEKLSDLNEEAIRYLMKALGIRTEVLKCSDFKLNSRGTDLIIDVCKKLGADTFLSGKHGRDYLDERMFADNDIKLLYQDFRHPVYRQVHGDFTEGMSVIDLLFNEGDESMAIIKKAQGTR